MMVAGPFSCPSLGPEKQMKYLVFPFLICLHFALTGFSQNPAINIIPKPKTVNLRNGKFTLSRRTKLVAADEVSRKMAEILNAAVFASCGFKLDLTGRLEKENAIIIVVEPASGNVRPEAYHLNIDPKSVHISGGERAVFCALQSLLQILPDSFKHEAALPAAEIADEPRFDYRGMLLDSARHFMPVPFVKKYIDLLSRYKFNYFQWHLTDDQGWRIEIKKYPRLTAIGSKRPETVKGRYLAPYIGDGIPVEGFYTQEEIKDVVEYARERYVTVIPEIELPGHSSAALAAYPELGCADGYDYKVQ